LSFSKHNLTKLIFLFKLAFGDFSSEFDFKTPEFYIFQKKKK